QGTGRNFYVIGVAVFWVPWGFGTPGAQRFEILHFESCARREELQIQGQRRVPGRQNETITALPVLIGGIKMHNVLEQLPSNRGERKSGAGVARTHFFNGVGGKHPQGIYHSLVLVRVHILSGWKLAVEWSSRI